MENARRRKPAEREAGGRVCTAVVVAISANRKNAAGERNGRAEPVGCRAVARGELLLSVGPRRRGATQVVDVDRALCSAVKIQSAVIQRGVVAACV